MKQLLAITIGLLIWGTASAQTPSGQKVLTAAEKRAADLRKNAVGGIIRNSRYRPIEGIKIFIYTTDSSNSIVASGFSDATGYYETNSVLPGTYMVKFVYPPNIALTIPGVTMKRGITDITLKADPPTADTTIEFSVFHPEMVNKEK